MNDQRGRIARQQNVALVDLVDRALNAGVVITGEVTLSLADIDLVDVRLRLLVGSTATVRAPSEDELEAGARPLLAQHAESTARDER